MIDEDGDEVLCGFCGETLDPATAEQVHDNSDEDGDLIWVCGTCVAAWQIADELSEAPEVNAQRIAVKVVEGAEVEFWQLGLATFVFRRVPGGTWALVKEIAS